MDQDSSVPGEQGHLSWASRVMPRMRLRTKILLAFVAILLPVLALRLWGFRDDLRQSERSILDAQLLTARAVGVQVDGMFDSAMAVAWAVANDPLVRTLDGQSLDKHLHRLAAKGLPYESIAVYDAQGNDRGWSPEPDTRPVAPTHARPSPQRPSNVAAREYFQAVMATNAPVNSGVIRLLRPPFPPTIAVAVPIRDEQGRAIGVTRVMMIAARLAEHYAQTSLRSDQAILLIDRNGRMAFHTLLPGLSWEQTTLLADSPAVEQAISGTPVTLGEFTGPTFPDPHLAAFAPSRKYGWVVGVTASRSEALAPVHAALRDNLLGLAGILLASAALGIVAARKLVNPVRQLQQQARLLGQGDLARRVEIATGDELQGLSESFNEMAAQIQQRDAALRESEARKSAMLEAGSDAIICMDHQGRIVEWNPAAERIFGHSREHALGREMAQLIIPDRQREPHRKGLAEYLATGQGLVLGKLIEMPAVRADGREFLVELSITHIRLPGPPIFTAFVRDITERKQAEQERAELLHREQRARAQAETASRAKDQFLAVVSHELRTPLTPVLAAVGLLKRIPGLPEEVPSLLDMIHRNIELEARLVGDLLDLTRVAQGKIRLQVHEVDAHELIGDMARLFQSELAGKRIGLSLDLRAADHHLRADPARVQQIVWNLLSNAIKFTPGGGSITIRSANEDNALRIEVADSGIGIEPEVMQRLFKPFEQGEQTLTRHYGGLGLGLSIVKALAELHGGTIQAASAGKGQGAVFTVTLPMEAPIRLEEAVPGLQPLPARPARILVVEDNEDTLRLLARLLRSMGHEVRTANSASAALEVASAESFDLLISDIGLPDATGWELMRQLRAEHPVKGIALSGFGTPEDIEKSRTAGFIEHLTKPINIQLFEQTIHRLVDNAPVHADAAQQ